MIIRELLADFKVDEEFANLLPIQQTDLDNIKKSIKDNGYEQAFPLIVWGEENIIVDGHTRFKAMQEIKFGGVIPCVRKFFNTRAEAVAFIMRCQTHRRNYSKEQFIELIKRCEPYMAKVGQIGKNHAKDKISAPTNGGAENSILTASDLANITGKSQRTVERALKKVREEKAEPKKEQKPNIPVEEKFKKAKETLNLRKQEELFKGWIDQTSQNVKQLKEKPIDKYDSEVKENAIKTIEIA